jgi:hypothetical protein
VHLTPSEAHVLLEPNTASAWSAVRTSLLHLAAAGYLRGEAQPKGRLGTGGGTLLLRGTADRRPADHLAVVLDALFPPGKPVAPLSSARMTSRLESAFGYDYGRYLARHLRPLLVTKGLLEVEAYRWLGIIPRRRYRHTEAGARLREAVALRLQRAGEVPELLRRDPRGAALSRLALIALLDDDEEERRADWLDAADLLAEADWGAVLEVVDGLGDAFDGGGSDGGDGGGE